jgi:predicted PurR-regulated permease PerM
VSSTEPSIFELIFKQSVIPAIILQANPPETQNDLMDWIRSSFHVTRHKQLTFVTNTTNKVVDSGGSVVGATLLSLSGMLLFLVFTFIYTFFFLLYRKLIMRFL